MGTKNCPETPRQKMINMMYLVLTAMLALNVAAETLQAFKTVDRSLMRTYNSFTERNLMMINDFAFQRELNPGKVQKWYDLVKKVEANSDSLVNYIIDTKAILAYGAGAYKHVPTEELPTEYPHIIVRNNDTLILEAQDNLNISPEIMITNGRGKELQAKIQAFRDELIGIVGDDKKIAANISSSLDVSDPERKKLELNKDEGENLTWVDQNFEATPVIAAITILSKLQIDIRNAQSTVMRQLYNNIDASSFKFTGLEAKVIPITTYVFQGQKYEARIFLSAVDSTKEITAYINGNSTALPVDKKTGEAVYTFTPTQLGTNTYRGEIKYKRPDGSDDSKFFESEYTVALPTATVSPTKMNVLYKSIKNPISISVPGISSDKLEVRFTNGTIEKEEDHWFIIPTDLDYTATKSKVQVYATVNGEKKLMAESPFRVKRVPDPKATVAQLSSGIIEKEKLGAQRGVFASMGEDFDFDLKFEVTSFDFSVATSGGMTSTLSSKSFAFTSEMKQVISSLGVGSKINIENIKAKMVGVPNDSERELSPIILTVR
jgi:gliding motility-associated protein GldM